MNIRHEAILDPVIHGPKTKTTHDAHWCPMCNSWVLTAPQPDGAFIHQLAPKIADFLKNGHAGKPKKPRKQRLPDPDGKNAERVKWAHDALMTFAKGRGGELVDGKITYKGIREQNLSDLLCDFGHYCDAHGLSLDDLLFRAAGHYNAETANKGNQFDFSDRPKDPCDNWPEGETNNERAKRLAEPVILDRISAAIAEQRHHDDKGEDPGHHCGACDKPEVQS